MRTLACVRAGGLLERRRAGLTDAERLELEQHVGECDDCHFESAALQTFADAVASAPTADVAASALRRALADRSSEVPPTRVAGRTPWALVGVALAASAALWVASGASDFGSSPSGSLTTAPKVSGRVEGVEPAPVRVGHGSVVARRASAFRWVGTNVTLERGQLAVEVDPSVHRAFRVHTPDFTVLVTGTSFVVSCEEVRVSRGSVQVLSPDGSVQASLSAGQRWQVGAPSGTGAGTEPEALTTPEAVSEVAAADPEAVTEPGPVSATEPRGAVGPVASSERPRRPASRPDVPSARSRFERAVRLSERSTDEAIAAFESLEREGGPWAANALFARGQLLMQRGRAAEARRALSSYLERYPGGLNAADARAMIER